ncbi:MAG: hypothetical protein NVSMB18_22190 [Acetobacteraceae bacterium]
MESLFSADVTLQTQQSCPQPAIGLVPPIAALQTILVHYGHMTDETLHNIATEQAPAGFMTPDLAQAILTGRAVLLA